MLASGRNSQCTAARLAILALTLAAAGCSGGAGGSSPPATPPDTSARAEQLTGLMLEKYREANSYTDHATYVEQAVYRGEGIEHELPFYQMSVAFQRPNKLRLTLEEALPSAEGVRDGCDIACDGDTLRARVLALPDQVLELPAPESLADENLLPDPVLRGVFQGRGLGEVFPQLAMLLSQDDEELIFPDDADARMLTDAELRGRTCYRVATTNPEGTRVLWIDRQTFNLWRMELPVEAHRRRYADGEMFLKLAVWIDFEEPTFGARIDGESFAFDAPEGARVVRQFDVSAAEAGGKSVADDDEEEKAARESRESARTEEDEDPSSEVLDNAGDENEELHDDEADGAPLADSENVDDASARQIEEEGRETRETTRKVEDARENAESEPDAEQPATPED